MKNQILLLISIVFLSNYKCQNNSTNSTTANNSSTTTPANTTTSANASLAVNANATVSGNSSNMSLATNTSASASMNASAAVVTPPFNYALPNFLGNIAPADLDTQINSSFQATIYMGFAVFYNNNCSDARVDAMNLSNSDPDYQAFCQMYALDFGQIFGNFSCNNWLCNFQGNCSFFLNVDGSVNQTCTCKSGWLGLNCMFPTQDHTYGVAWTLGSEKFITKLTANNTNPIVNEAIFLSVLDIIDNVLTFTSNADPTVAVAMDISVGNSMSALFNANVNLSANGLAQVNLFLVSILGDPNLSGVDPNQVTGAFGTSGTNSSTYGYYDTPVTSTSDVSLGGSRRILAKKLLGRVMASNSTNSNINQASPTVVVPQATAALLPQGAKLSLSFVKNPVTYNTPSTPTIVSQVVTVNCKVNKTMVPFPNGPALTINLPWSYVPYTIGGNGTYNTSCIVYKYINSTFFVEPLCIIDGVNSNSQKIVLNCKNFGNFAVACKGASVSTLKTYTKNTTNSTSTTSNQSISQNKTGATSYSVISLVLISILSLIII